MFGNQVFQRCADVWSNSYHMCIKNYIKTILNIYVHYSKKIEHHIMLLWAPRWAPEELWEPSYERLKVPKQLRYCSTIIFEYYKTIMFWYYNIIIFEYYKTIMFWYYNILIFKYHKTIMFWYKCIHYACTLNGVQGYQQQQQQQQQQQ